MVAAEDIVKLMLSSVMLFDSVLYVVGRVEKMDNPFEVGLSFG
jgi:hypothetical protein